MTPIGLPSFEIHPFTPSLPKDGSPALRISITLQQGKDRTGIWVLAGAYRIPPDPLLQQSTPLPALVAVAINCSTFIPFVRQLGPDELSMAPTSRTRDGGYEGVFAVDLVQLFQLQRHTGRLSVICSILGWTSEPVELEMAGS